MILEVAITTNIGIGITAFLVYFYLYMHCQKPYMACWLLAWLVYFIRQVLYVQYFSKGPVTENAEFLFFVLTLWFSLLMLAGTKAFIGKEKFQFEIAVGIAGIVAALVEAVVKLPFQFYMFPAAVVSGYLYIITGILFWEMKGLRWARRVVSVAFFLMGLYILAVQSSLPELTLVIIRLWVDCFLKIAVAIGIVIVYFESVNNELSERENYYQMLAEHATDVIFRYRLAKPRGFEYVSPAAKNLTGYPPEFFRDIRQVLKIIYIYDRKKMEKAIRMPVSNGDYMSLRIRRKDGDIAWAEQKNSVLYDIEGKAIAVEGIIRDITQRVLLNNDFARLEQLNVAGKMATNLAHEVRNPLTTLRGYLQFLGSKNDLEKYRTRFSLMLEEVDRANRIITEYLWLSKNKCVNLQKGDLNEFVSKVYPTVKAEASAAQVEVKLVLSEIPEIWLDEKEIRQLILHLVHNAVEAMPQGGKIRLSTFQKGDSIVLSVKDGGKGIPPHLQNDIGKPFLTTKENGTGLGMAICYRIAGRHHAKLNINTGVLGTTICVVFPIV